MFCLGSRDHESWAGAGSGRGHLASVFAALCLPRTFLLCVEEGKGLLVSAGLGVSCICCGESRALARELVQGSVWSRQARPTTLEHRIERYF